MQCCVYAEVCSWRAILQEHIWQSWRCYQHSRIFILSNVSNEILLFKIIFHKLGTKCYELLVLYLRYIYARSSLCWTARIMPTLRDKLLGFLLTSESSSNYVCSCPNVNARWHHHTLHRCASSCRPTLVVVSYDQRLVMIFSLIPRTRTASHVRST